MAERNESGSMADLAPHDRPREKLSRAGVFALGDNELLAVLIGHGTSGAGALTLANRLLAAAGGPAGLTRLGHDHLARQPGIGAAVAGRILAGIELGRRTLMQPTEPRPQFLSPAEAGEFLLPLYGASAVERFGVVLLDARNRLIEVRLLTTGSVDISVALPRDVFRVALLARAAGVILFHNHPSGDARPSGDDRELTRRFADAGRVMGIEVLDHLILTHSQYLFAQGMGAPHMSRVMYLDGFAGAAGDMVLGALLDAGLPAEELRRALGSLSVGHELRITRVQRAGISATRVEVGEAPAHDHAHAADHDPGDHHHHGPDDRMPPHSPHAAHTRGGHGHRSLTEIADLIGKSALSAAGKTRAVALFQRLAEAEAAIHGMPVSKVHLHEVGALDSIIDIVGAVFAFEWFGITDIVASPLNVGGGMVTMAHGTFPVPAPATLRLLGGAPIYGSGVQTELLTPTGALLISGYATRFGPVPEMTVDRIGYGAGTRELDPLPNVLRVLVGHRRGQPARRTGDETVLKIECEIDDMSPQLFGPVTDRLMASGVLDVFLTPIQMKKGRPGTLLTVLAPPPGATPSATSSSARRRRLACGSRRSGAKRSSAAGRRSRSRVASSA